MKKTFNKNLKENLLNEIRRHREADQITQGIYGDPKNSARGFCAVGCAIHSLNTLNGTVKETNDHIFYADTVLGGETALAYLENKIFEMLPKKQAILWPERFITAVPEDTDLSLAMPRFFVWLMDEISQYAEKSPSVLAAINAVKELCTRKINGDAITKEEWKNAAYAAADAAYAAAYAARAAYAVIAAKMADKIIEILENSTGIRILAPK